MKRIVYIASTLIIVNATLNAMDQTGLAVKFSLTPVTAGLTKGFDGVTRSISAAGQALGGSADKFAQTAGDAAVKMTTAVGDATAKVSKEMAVATTHITTVAGKTTTDIGGMVADVSKQVVGQAGKLSEQVAGHTADVAKLITAKTGDVATLVVDSTAKTVKSVTDGVERVAHHIIDMPVQNKDTIKQGIDALREVGVKITDAAGKVAHPHVSVTFGPELNDRTAKNCMAALAFWHGARSVATNGCTTIGGPCMLGVGLCLHCADKEAFKGCGQAVTNRLVDCVKNGACKRYAINCRNCGIVTVAPVVLCCGALCCNPVSQGIFRYIVDSFRSCCRVKRS